MCDPPTLLFFNVRGLGISKVTPSGNQKLDYIYSVSPKTNCIICLVEVWFNWGSLPTLGLSVPAPYKLAHLNSDGKGSGIMILVTSDIVKDDRIKEQDFGKYENIPISQWIEMAKQAKIQLLDFLILCI